MVDHQVVNLQFANDVTASFTMCAFTYEGSRIMNLMGTRGQIKADMEKNTIEVFDFLTGNQDVITIETGVGGHSGSDEAFVRGFLRTVETNGAYALSSASQSVQSHLIALAQALQAGLAQRVPGVPIHVCTARGSLAYADVWMCAQRMRNILKQKIVPAKSSCFLLEEDETSQSGDNLGILKMHIADHLRTALEQKDTAAVRAELQLIFKYMSDNHLPQQDWQRVMLYILRMMEFSGGGSVDLQTETLRCVSRMNDEAKCVSVCVSAMMACLDSKSAADTEDPDMLVRRLKKHLDANYLVLENLEDVTKVFAYSYAYLSRLFRKEYDVSMNHYVTSLRVELAKRLIQNNENLSMIEISRMAGFSDNYYFSRVFKNVTGNTPTEYKSKIILKG
ncbi:MAG: helix-turn-helix transcriptional regulator [Ruthenibacterium sp.]